MDKRLEKIPNTILESVTTPQLFHKERHEKGINYYKEVTYTQNGDMILNGKIKKEKISISRATCNFSGAYPYLFDVLSYTCTHFKDKIKEVDYYYSITIPYDIFLDFALDGCTGQKRYLQNELYRFNALKQNKLIAIDDKSSLYAMPVVLLFIAGERKLSEAGKRGVDNLGVETYAEIQILFLKCLFKDIKENGNKYKDFVKALFAKLKAIENVFENKYVYRNPDTGLNRLVNKKELQKLIQDNNIKIDMSDLYPLSRAVSAEVLYKLLNYFRLKDNSKNDRIRLKGIDVLKHCAPQYIQTRKDSQGNPTDYYKNIEEAKMFLMLLAIAINEVCGAGILNAMPQAKMRNLITRIENVQSGDILIYYGNRKEKG